MSPQKRDLQLTVRMVSPRATRGFVQLGNTLYPCALGRSGSRYRKREGDGATPRGHWTLLRVLYRADHGLRPRTALPLRTIRRADGWCDGVGDRNYNRGVRLPYAASTERMHRDDHLYDVVVVLSHNQRPRQQGLGSAIFMHIARAGYLPTEGCIALKPRDMRLLLMHCSQRTRVLIS